MRIVARITPGPAWLPERTLFEQGQALDDHLAFMQTRFDDGSLLVGGPLATEQSGAALLEAPDLSAARELVDQDPAARAGVLVYELHQLLPYFDALTGTRASGTAGDQARRPHSTGTQTP